MFQIRKRLLVVGIAALSGCATAPAQKSAHFDVQWIRSTLENQNYGYRHPERTAPLIDGDILYQGNGVDSFVALKKSTGAVIWRKSIRGGIESGSALANDLILFGASDGNFYALKKYTGQVVWTFPTRSETLAQPLVDGSTAYFLAGNNILYALDTRSGKQIWFYNRGEASSLSIRGGSRPTLYKGTLYVGFSDGFLVALNAKDGSLTWERKLNENLKFVDIDATPVIDEDHIWISSFDGALFCLSRKDGQIQWRIEDGGATPVTISGDTLYFSSTNQNVYAVNKITGAVKWKYATDERFGVATQPVLSKGLVIFGLSGGNLVGVSETSGTLSASYFPGLGIFATPWVDKDGWIYVFSNEGNIHALKLAWHERTDDFEWKR